MTTFSFQRCWPMRQTPTHPLAERRPFQVNVPHRSTYDDKRAILWSRTHDQLYEVCKFHHTIYWVDKLSFCRNTFGSQSFRQHHAPVHLEIANKTEGFKICVTASAAFVRIWTERWLLIHQCHDIVMMTSSNGNIFGDTCPLCGEFTGNRWIPLRKASDAELWCFRSAPEWTIQ